MLFLLVIDPITLKNEFFIEFNSLHHPNAPDRAEDGFCPFCHAVHPPQEEARFYQYYVSLFQEEGMELPSQALLSGLTFQAVVDMLPLSAGHCLITPHDHCLSFADSELIDERASQEFAHFLNRLDSINREDSTREHSIQALHVDSLSSQADCGPEEEKPKVVHDHYHYIPIPEDFDEEVETLLDSLATHFEEFEIIWLDNLDNGTILESIASNARGRGFQFFRHGTRGFMIIADDFESQIHRRVVAETFYGPQTALWDWRDPTNGEKKCFAKNLMGTFELFYPEDKAVIGWYGGSLIRALSLNDAIPDPSAEVI